MPKKTKPDEQKTERFNMFMSPSEMQAINEWSWENRVRSKSEAVRILVQVGLRFLRSATEIHDESNRVASYLLDWQAEVNEIFEDEKSARHDIMHRAALSLADHLYDATLLQLNAHNDLVYFIMEVNELTESRDAAGAIAAADAKKIETSEKRAEMRAFLEKMQGERE